MFILDAVKFEEKGKAHVIVNGINRKWPAQSFRLLERGTSVRIISPSAKLISEISTWILGHPNFGPGTQLHTTRRDDDRFLTMSWGDSASN